MNNKNLLIITHKYANFVKDQVDIIANSFNHIYVIVRHNPIADISCYLPISYLEPFNRRSIIDLKNKPVNVSVLTTNIIYGPTNKQYIGLGDKHFKAVNNIIQKHNLKFDLIHTHFLWSSGYAGAKLKEIYKAPLVITAHGYDIYDLPFRNEMFRNHIEYVLNSADTIITVSKSNLDCIDNLKVQTPTKIIPNGFRSDLFFPMNQQTCKRTLNISNNAIIILSVGNLAPIKGHIYLIEAMREINKKRKDILCVIVGSGRQRSTIEKLINKYDLGDYVILAGAKPHHEIPIWMNACDLFVLPSINEGNPTVLVESLGTGKPYVGTNVGGIPEIINSEDYGLLCNPGDPNALASNILKALDKEWDYKKIAEYAKKYDWKSITGQINKIYEPLIQD